MPTTTDPSPESNEPLPHFALPRTVVRGVRACSEASAEKGPGDIFYLWLQLGPEQVAPSIATDDWLNVIDEAAAAGVNWLVISLGAERASLDVASALCRWAQEPHQMTVCVHTPEPAPYPELESLMTSLAPESSYLLVESGHSEAYTTLESHGVRVGLASPEPHDGDSVACEYPYKMVFVDASGDLYTCGLVAGEKDFFLGSVFKGSLERIVHNPKLPHSVDALETRPKHGCSGCPPLVAKYLCQH